MKVILQFVILCSIAVFLSSGGKMPIEQLTVKCRHKCLELFGRVEPLVRGVCVPCNGPCLSTEMCPNGHNCHCLFSNIGYQQAYTIHLLKL
uniref:Uncharacterized protein n=1 Tax=Romanomermis culicivorax TaxID=13658 RepID=A0A915JBM0_ROMCU